MKKPIALVLTTVAVGILIYWLVSGAHIFTQTQVMVEVKDELFGTSTKEWRDEFRLGLEYAGSAAAVLLVIAGVLFWKEWKERRTSAV